jgi:general secretion pathway protein A
MYTAFYGLREKPFALSPDPRFLFLAESHREALAHLLYGIEQGEGFIAITGEVGTGKTTLCRTLLRRLGPEVEVAFLFNPQLTAQELIGAIHSELGIESRSETLRERMDELNRYLLERQREGRRVLLIVDEAQGLAPEALEEIRLLSNLETETSKLIQILLLGQPELEAMLGSSSLRQLRQRIGVRWCLNPLHASETRAYVRHRLRIAGGVERDIFSGAALRKVHQLSRGIPRLINLLCDRALLAGYATRSSCIGRRLVRRADRELRQGGGSVGHRRPLAWFATALGVLVLGGLAWRFGEAAVPAVGRLAELGFGDATPATSTGALLAATEGEVEAMPPAEPRAQPEATLAFDSNAEPPLVASFESAVVEVEATDPPHDIATPTAPLLPALVTDPSQALAKLSPGVTAAAALKAILEAWKLPFDPSSNEILSFPEVLGRLSEGNLAVLALSRTDLVTLSSLGHPALLEVEAADGIPRVVALRTLTEEEALVAGVDEREPVRVPLPQLERHWGGGAYVVWRDFEDLPEILRFGDVGPPVAWLQFALRELGFYSETLSARFDTSTLGAVRAFQHDRRLVPDGEVGPRTKMALYEALPRYSVPRLAQAEDAG